MIIKLIMIDNYHHDYDDNEDNNGDDDGGVNASDNRDSDRGELTMETHAGRQLLFP